MRRGLDKVFPESGKRAAFPEVGRRDGGQHFHFTTGPAPAKAPLKPKAGLSGPPVCLSCPDSYAVECVLCEFFFTLFESGRLGIESLSF